jgi:ankyrin
VELVELLLSLDADPDRPDAKNRGPLSYAARRNHKKIVDLFLSRGADADRPDKNGRAPISYAVEAGGKGLVTLFILKGAQVNRPDKVHGGIIMHALKHKDVELVRLLYDAGASIDVFHVRSQTTPLVQAVSTGRAEIVKFLIEKGAKVDEADEDNESPLWKAARFKHQDIALILLEAGADPLIAAIGCDEHDPDDGKSALDVAKENNLSEIVELMEKIIQQRQVS